MQKNILVTVHDIFNLLYLSIILFYLSQFISFNISLYALLTNRSEQLILLHNDISYFEHLFYTFLSYILIDTIWIITLPQSILSNHIALIVHHTGVIALLYIPWTYRKYSCYMGLLIFSEVNTFFLILKRFFTKNSFLFFITNSLFMTSWLLIRLIMYPILCVLFVKEYIDFSIQEYNGNYLNVALIGPIMQFLLTFLSFKWTYDIMYNKRLTNNIEEKK